MHPVTGDSEREAAQAGRAARRAQWEEAALASLFRKDLEEREEAFPTADAETAREID